MKINNIILIAVLILGIFGCAPNQPEKMVESAVQNEVEDAARGVAMDAKNTVEDKVSEESQELVNFKCTIAGMQTIYFLKEKAKIESAGRESWLNDDGFFAKMEVSGEPKLVQYPAEESEIDFKDMMVTYEMSKTNDVYDCELDVVTEDDVTLPDLEIVTPDALANDMLAQMSQVGLE